MTGVPEEFGQARSHGAGLRIHANARREPHDNPDGFAFDRKLLRLGARAARPNNMMGSRCRRWARMDVYMVMVLGIWNGCRTWRRMLWQI